MTKKRRPNPELAFMHSEFLRLVFSSNTYPFCNDGAIYVGLGVSRYETLEVMLDIERFNRVWANDK